MELKPLPFVLCGDFNSHPVSSVLSAIYGEDIEDEKSSWTIPYNYIEPPIRKQYKNINKMYMDKLKDG